MPQNLWSLKIWQHQVVLKLDLEKDWKQNYREIFFLYPCGSLLSGEDELERLLIKEEVLQLKAWARYQGETGVLSGSLHLKCILYSTPSPAWLSEHQQPYLPHTLEHKIEDSSLNKLAQGRRDRKWKWERKKLRIKESILEIQYQNMRNCRKGK